jgi:glycine/D-amino acid oxidase-like deaminating enzyme
MRYDAHGWWLRDAGPVEPCAPLEGEASADVIVVGGGYAGMWTAWLIAEAEPNAKVAIVEKEICGEGPSGRNGGFVNSMWFSLASMRPRFGDEPALAVAQAAEAAIDEVGGWCESEGVDAWYRKAGYLQISTTPAHDHVWDETVQACSELGAADAVQVLDADAVAERFASPVFRGAAFFPAAATVNPALLGRGLRAKLIERGVQLYERSRVTGVESGSGSVRVRTGSGSVTASQVVIAAGGAQAAIGPLAHRFTLSSSHMVITEPVPELLEEIGWDGGECVTDARHMLNYLRTTRDGRIAFGWGGGRVQAGARTGGRAEIDPQVTAGVMNHVSRFFPGLRGKRFDHAWGGPIDVSPSHTPIVGSLDPRVHYCFGFTGNGVGPSRMAAHCLSSLALERRDEYSRLAIVEQKHLKVPPEPFRYVGGTIIRRALLRREGLEEQDRRPDPLTRFVAAVPEMIGIQVGR